ncbi:MAG: hypothetical protein AAF638_05660 [Pseudomonadota bacterium]
MAHAHNFPAQNILLQDASAHSVSDLCTTILNAAPAETAHNSLAAQETVLSRLGKLFFSPFEKLVLARDLDIRAQVLFQPDGVLKRRGLTRETVHAAMLDRVAAE